MKKLLLITSALLLTIGVSAQFVSLEVEEYAVHTGMVGDVDLTGFTTYRLYVNMTSQDDFLSACFAEPDKPLRIETSTSFYQDAAGSLTGAEINPAFYGFIPSMEFDSWVTIGRAATTDPGAGISTIQSSTDPWITDFNIPGGNIIIDGLYGGSWYALNGDVNGLAGPDLKVLVGQFTTDGDFGGILTFQVFPLGIGSNAQTVISEPFSSNPAAMFGCTDPEANNFDPAADTNDYSCIYPCALAISNVVLTPNDCPGGTAASILIQPEGGQGATYFSLNGSNNQLSPAYNNLAGGVYSLTLTDTQGCSYTEEIDVTDPDPIEIDLTVANSISCNGEVDAAITGAATGGTGTVMFGLADNDLNSPSSDFSDLGAGSYTVYAMDENGCEGSSNTVEIIEPSAVSLVLAVPSDATCFDTNDGSVTITANGGTGALSYSLDGVDYVSNNVVPASPGTYTSYVQDENGCTVSTAFQVTVNGGAEITLDGNTTAALCSDSSDGSVELAAGGGNGGFEYSFNGSEFSAETAYSDLMAGTYDAVVMDMDGCEFATTIEIEAPDAVEAMGTVTDIACNGDANNGMIDLSAAGGNGTYMYSFDGGDFSDVTNYMDLAAGEYSIEVMDENGCAGEAITAEVMEPAVIEASATSTTTLCNGSEDGVVTADGTGGTGDLSYSINGVDFSAENMFDGLAAGDYTITVQDENMCMNTADVSVDEPEVIAITATATEDSGAGDGSITLEVTGGTGNYSFAWTGPNGFTADTQDIADLEGGLGDYMVTVTDENDCSTSEDVVVTVGITEIFAAMTIGVSPNPSNGDFVLNINGANGERINMNVLDGLGRIVIKDQLNVVGTVRQDVNLNSQADGIYFLQLSAGTEMMTIKLIKQ